MCRRLHSTYRSKLKPEVEFQYGLHHFQKRELVLLQPWIEISHRYLSMQIDIRLFNQGLNERGVTKHSDFGPIEGYILETVQDMMSAINQLVPKSVT